MPGTSDTYEFFFYSQRCKTAIPRALFSADSSSPPILNRSGWGPFVMLNSDPLLFASSRVPFCTLNSTPFSTVGCLYLLREAPHLPPSFLNFPIGFFSVLTAPLCCFSFQIFAGPTDERFLRQAVSSHAYSTPAR